MKLIKKIIVASFLLGVVVVAFPMCVFAETSVESIIEPMEMTEKSTYIKNGKKIANLIQDVLNSDTEKICYVEPINSFGSTKFKQTLYEYCDSGLSYQYYGKLKKGYPNGWGVLIYGENIVYVGEFKKGFQTGYGLIMDRENSRVIYEGELKKGNYEGKGTVFYPEFKYTGYLETMGILPDDYGEITKTQVHGDGVIGTKLFKTPVLYSGNLKKGKYVGKGTLYYIDGQIMYEGKFKDEVYHGKGNLYFENGVLEYSGKFKNGSYHGKGKLYDEAGNLIYSGKFKNGDME